MASQFVKALAWAIAMSVVWVSSVSQAAPTDDRDTRLLRYNGDKAKRVESRQRPAQSRDQAPKANYKRPESAVKRELGRQNLESRSPSERQRIVPARETQRNANPNQGPAQGAQELIRREYHHRDNRQNDSDRRRSTSRTLNQPIELPEQRRDQRHLDYRERDYIQRDYRERDRPTRPQVVLNRHYHHPGHQIRRLPTGIRRLYHRPFPLYYFGGTYYRPYSGGFVVVSAPLGVRVRSLPIGFVTLTFGSSRYYYVNDVYYQRFGTEYIVVEAPRRRTTQVASNVYTSGDWQIYPRYGQTDATLQQDRYECHLWAFDRTHYDPSQPHQDNRRRGDYYRAQAACLEGRGYTIK